MGTRSIGAVLSLAATTSAIAATSDSSNLKLLVYQSKISNPTGAVFVNSRYALVTQKNDGKVLLLRDGKTVGTALDLKVANRGQQGLLDIALSPNFVKDKLVYLYLNPSDKDGGYSGSTVVNSYYYVPALGELVFRETLLRVPKAKKETDVSGVITFNSKNRPKITQPPPAGAVFDTSALTSAGALGTVKLVHGGLPNAGSASIALAPRNTMQNFTGGTLTLSSSYGSISLTGPSAVTSGQLVLKPVTGFNSSTIPSVNTGTITINPYPGLGSVIDLTSPYPMLGSSGTLNGQLILTGSNGYLGQTQVNAGTLVILNPGHVGTGSLTIGGGTITLVGGAATNPRDPLVEGSNSNEVHGILAPYVAAQASNSNSDIDFLATGTMTTPTSSSGQLTMTGSGAMSGGTISLITSSPGPADSTLMGGGTIDLSGAIPTVLQPTVVPSALLLPIAQTPEPGVIGLTMTFAAGSLLRRRRTPCRA